MTKAYLREVENLWNDPEFLLTRLCEQTHHLKKATKKYVNGVISIDRLAEIQESALNQKWRIEDKLKKLGIKPH